MQNRQNGRRRRGGGNNPRPMGQPMGGQGNASRLEVRVRGNAHQLLEKYKVMARDAHQAGDRVAAEYYLQHADHYFRVLNDSRIRQDEMRARRGAFDPLDDDQDQDDEGGEEVAAEPEMRPEPRPERADRRDRGNDRGERNRDLAGQRRERAGERPPERQPARGDDRAADPGWHGRDAHGADEAPPAAAMSDGEAALAAFGGVPVAELEAPPAPRRRGRPRKVAAEPAPGPAADG